MTGRLRRLLAAPLGAAVVASLLAVSSGPAKAETPLPAPVDPKINVVDIGDSYAAGNGADPYREAECFTSDGNAGEVFFRTIGSTGTHTNLACGGYVIRQIREEWRGMKDADRAGVDVVLLSAGGNDAHFSSIVTYCLAGGGQIPQVLASNLGSEIAKVAVQWGVLTLAVEPDDPAFLGEATVKLLDPDTYTSICNRLLDKASEALDAVGGDFATLLDETADNFRNATIVVMGYPDLHVDNGSVASAIRSIRSAYSSLQSRIVDKFNTSPLHSGRAVFVDRSKIFAGHEIGSSQEWLHEIGDGVFDGWYHPTRTGWSVTGTSIAERVYPMIRLRGIAAGNIVRLTDDAAGRAWLVDADKVRHELRNGGDFNCAVKSGSQVIEASQPELDFQLPIIGAPMSTWCLDVDGIAADHDRLGSMVTTTTGHEYHLWVPAFSRDVMVWEAATSAAARCMEARIGAAHTGFSDAELETFAGFRTGTPDGRNWCLNPAEVDGKILVDATTGTSWVMEATDVTKPAGEVIAHRIPDTETFAFEASRRPVERGYTHDDLEKSDNVRQGSDVPIAVKVEDYEGSLLETPDHYQYLVWQHTRYWVRDAATSRCFTELEHRHVRPLDWAHTTLIPEAAGQWARCDGTKAYAGKIIRNPATAAALRVGADGVAHPIREAETFRCLTGKGVAVVELAGSAITGFLVGDPEPVCLNAWTFADMVVRGPSTSTYYVNPGTLTLSPILNGGGYRCLTTWAGKQVHPEQLTAEQIAAFTPGSSATCGATAVANGKLVRSASGAAIVVDAAGTAHAVPTGHAYSCANDVMPRYDVADDTWLEAFAYGTNYPSCEKLLLGDTGASYYQSTDGVVHWLRNTQSFYCFADRGIRQIRLAQSTIASLPQGAWAPDCLSTARYRNTIIRRGSDGAAWIVDDQGRRRWIPDGYSWECYRARGYQVVEWNLSYEAANSISEVGRMGYCLAPWQAIGTIIREGSTGTSYYVNGAGQRMWIPDGLTFEALQSWGVPVLNWGLDWEHIGSLPEVGRYRYAVPVWRVRNTLIRQDNGVVFYVDGGGTRHWVRDWYTVERLNELGVGFSFWSLNGEHITSLGESGWQGRMLPAWRVRGHVVRAWDGTAYFVTRDNRWHWISSGSLYNWLVSRYGFAGSYDWDQLNSLRWYYGEGGWAQWW